MNVPRINGFHEVRNTSARGVFTFFPDSTAFLNTGVSSSRNRTYSPTMTMTALSRKGIRQPQVIKAPSKSPSVWFKTVTRIRKKPLATRKPNGAPSCGHMAAQARFPLSAVSVANNAAPDHSPPSPRP